MRKLILSGIGILLLWAVNGFAEDAAKIKFVIGDAQKLPAHQTSWEKVQLNGLVYQGDRIKTALDSRVELEMPDGSKIRIDQNTIFDVKEIKTGAEDKMSFSVWAGNIWASFKKIISDRQTRQVESPSAVVAVRGTIFEVNVDQEQTTRVSVEEGRVTVTSKDTQGEVSVGMNQQTVVRKGHSPSDPVEINKNEEELQEGNNGFILRLKKPDVMQTDPSVLMGGLRLSGQTVAGAIVNADGQPLPVNNSGQFNGTVRVTEGLNNIQVTAEKDGQKLAESIRVFVNTHKPEVRLSTPLVRGFLNRRDYSLSGAVFDATPLDKITVTINGEEITEVRGRGTFNRTIILSEGKNQIQVVATDISKNQGLATEEIFLDTVKPIITVTEPAQVNFQRFEPPSPPGGSISSSLDKQRFTQTIRGLITDPEPSSGLKKVVVNGKEIQPKSDGSFETEISVVRGENQITIYAEDMAGNITRETSRKITIR